jgi:hypothetical protein
LRVEGCRIEFHDLSWLCGLARGIARRRNIQSLYLYMEARIDFEQFLLNDFHYRSASYWRRGAWARTFFWIRSLSAEVSWLLSMREVVLRESSALKAYGPRHIRIASAHTAEKWP